MQCTLKLFEWLPQGPAQGAANQKVAVKWPADGQFGSASGESGFAEIMAALLSLPADQLENSLAQLETVAVGDGTQAQVPVIDFAQLLGLGARLCCDPDGQAPDPEAGTSELPDDLLAPDGAAQLIATLGAMAQTAEAEPEGFVGKAPTDAAGTEMAVNEAVARATLEKIFEKMTQKADGSGLSAKTPASPSQPADIPGQFFAGLQGRGQKPTEGPIEGQVKVPAPETAADAQDGATENIGTELARRNGRAPMTAKPTASATAESFGQRIATAAHQANPAAGREGEAVDTRIADTNLKPQVVSPPEGQTGMPGTGNSAQDSGPTTPQEGANASLLHSSAGAKSNVTLQADNSVPDPPTGTREMETDVIRQIVQRMTLRSDGRQSQMQIRLKPEFLGNLRMDVITENRLVLVRMTAESQAVKEMIEQHLGLLKTELQQHGLQIQKIDVTVSSGNDHGQSGQQQAVFDQARQRNGHGQGGRRGDGQKGPVRVNGIEGEPPAVRRHVKTSEVDFFA